ncbi:MAG: deoxyuridine 5'-triphosphate nucleotidohydrolase [Bacilli bacterium]
MRKFEKISFKQFKKDIEDDKEKYNNFSLPKRSTKYSAGYDFYAIKDYIIKPKERLIIPTGVKVTMEHDEMLMLLVRSSMGFKYNVRLCNQVGIIESDYYNNIDNEGHMFIALQNEGDKDFVIKANDKYIQGIFVKFLTVFDEELVIKQRISGIGSTNEEEKK